MPRSENVQPEWNVAGTVDDAAQRRAGIRREAAAAGRVAVRNRQAAAARRAQLGSTD